MKTVRKLGAVAIALLVAGCASKTVKRDPYADAAYAKRVEIDRLSKQIAELRASPDSVLFATRIDSLESVKSIAQASLGGIGNAVEEERKMNQDHANQNGMFRPYHDSTYNKKYPIKKP